MLPHYYSIHPTPIGDALIVVSRDRLVSLEVVDTAPDLVLADRAGRYVDAVRDDAAGATVSRQLDEYFAGTRRGFDLEIAWESEAGFTRAALEEICRIPYGETASYGEVALRAGSPRAHRAVGTACASTPISIVIPAHRVVRSDGSIGQYGGHPEHKQFLLDLEARCRP